MFTDFEYADKRLSDFGWVVGYIGGNSGVIETDIGCDITFNTVKNNHSSIHYVSSTSYDNVCILQPFDIFKSPCGKNQEDMYVTNDEVSALTMWLNRHGYRKFKPLYNYDDSDVHYYGSFNIKKKIINDRIVGLVLTFNSNAPYGFGEQIINEVDMECNDITASGEVVTTTDSAKVKQKNIKLFGKSKQDGTPSMENKVEVVSHGESGSIVGKVCTSQLLKTFASKTETKNGVTCTIYESGNISLSGTSTGYTSFELGTVNYLQARQYYNNGWGTNNNVFFQTIGGFVLGSTSSENKNIPFEIVDSNPSAILYLVISQANVNCDGLKPKLMISVEPVDKYEPYTEQLFTSLTPNGLRGIPIGTTIPDAIKNNPIHMSGVYWDSVEQRYYIGDTKNEDGNDVQRIGEYIITGNEYWQEEQGTYGGQLPKHLVECTLFTHGVNRTDYVYGTSGWFHWNGDVSELQTLDAWKNFIAGKVMYYVLTEPIITETDVQYDVVMNYPNTTIVNDEGAFMEVTYLQDYDNKFVICGDSDEYKTIYPNISITCKRDGDLRIKNSVTGNIFEILNCSEGETIYVNGEHKFIDSDNEIHKSTTLFNDFNYNYLDINVSDDDFSENIYETSIPCKIVIDYSPIRKVGV